MAARYSSNEGILWFSIRWLFIIAALVLIAVVAWPFLLLVLLHYLIWGRAFIREVDTQRRWQDLAAEVDRSDDRPPDQGLDALDENIRPANDSIYQHASVMKVHRSVQQCAQWPSLNPAASKSCN
jgi:hypothetical protein